MIEKVGGSDIIRSRRANRVLLFSSEIDDRRSKYSASAQVFVCMHSNIYIPRIYQYVFLKKSSRCVITAKPIKKAASTEMRSVSQAPSVDPFSSPKATRYYPSTSLLSLCVFSRYIGRGTAKTFLRSPNSNAISRCQPRRWHIPLFKRTAACKALRYRIMNIGIR